MCIDFFKFYSNINLGIFVIFFKERNKEVYIKGYM